MENKNSITDHYNGSAETYHQQYERQSLSDLSKIYPTNYFRMHLLLNSFVENDIKNAVEIGVGEGTPLVQLAKAGMSVCGIDIS